MAVKGCTTLTVRGCVLPVMVLTYCWARAGSTDKLKLEQEALPVDKTMWGNANDGFRCEGNYYYDLNSCGIGFHGDSERRKVGAVRLGASSALHFQWHLNQAPLGEPVIIPLHRGGFYMMSEKAVGTDWTKSKTCTLRHATGAPKFTQPQLIHIPDR
jgi:hypothetical protein